MSLTGFAGLDDVDRRARHTREISAPPLQPTKLSGYQRLNFFQFTVQRGHTGKRFAIATRVQSDQYLVHLIQEIAARASTRPKPAPKIAVETSLRASTNAPAHRLASRHSSSRQARRGSGI